MPQFKGPSGSSSSAKAPGHQKPHYVGNSMVLAGVQTSLNVLKDVVGVIPGTPGLQEAVKGLLVVCEAIQVRNATLPPPIDQ